MSCRAAGGKADDDAHRPRRIGLRPRDARHGRQRGSARGQMQKFFGGEVSSCFFPEMLNDEPDSFSLDIRGLEDRPPLLDLSLVVGRECLRILILARRNFLAEIGEPLAHAGIG